jgi:hypothetical protein
MHDLKTNFDKILEVLKSILQKEVDSLGNFPKVGKKPKFSDLEVISLNLTSEYLSIDSENLLFKKLDNQYREDFPNLIDRTQYNRRKKSLFQSIEQVRKLISCSFTSNEDVFIIDSMPLEICRNARANRLKICKEEFETSPEKGFCASQNQYYFGYKLHGVCTFDGVFSSIDLTKANVHDIHYLQDVKIQLADCTLLGDKGYLSANQQLDLFASANIKLETPMRTNQVGYKKQPFIFRKSRKRIETLYSQLCDQFMIRRNYAKSFIGFKTRILSKITALTIVQYINRFIYNRPINLLKHAI